MVLSNRREIHLLIRIEKAFRQYRFLPGKADVILTEESHIGTG